MRALGVLLILSFCYYSCDQKKMPSKSDMKDDETQRLASQLQKKMALEDDDGLELKLSYDHVIGPISSSQGSNDENSMMKNDLIRCPRYYYASIGELNRTFRDQVISSGEIYKAREMNGVCEHWVYFACHLLNWEAFDPVTKNWIALPTIEGADKCFEFSDKESMGVGTQLLVLGKDVLGQVIYKYSILTNSWSEAEVMKKPRCLFGSASLGKKAIFAGGVDGNGKIVDTVEMYDSETGSWEVLPSLLKPRKMSSGVYMDGKFYVIGGTGGGEAYTCGEEYDPVTKKWRLIPKMYPGGGGGGSSAPPLLAVVDNELYVADCGAMEVKKYDKKRNWWWSVGRLPERASNVDGWGIAFRGCGKRVVIVGGPRTHSDTHVDIYSWVPSHSSTPQWTVIGRKKSDSFVYNCAIMGC